MAIPYSHDQEGQKIMSRQSKRRELVSAALSRMRARTYHINGIWH
jgi:hypothetical protein